MGGVKWELREELAYLRTHLQQQNILAKVKPPLSPQNSFQAFIRSYFLRTTRKGKKKEKEEPND